MHSKLVGERGRGEEREERGRRDGGGRVPSLKMNVSGEGDTYHKLLVVPSLKM